LKESEPLLAGGQDWARWVAA